MNFIEELYYGNINPNEKRYDKDTHYAKTMRKFCDSENELGKMLKGKPLHLVNDLINASDEIVATTSIENFKLGFRLGVQMICDSLICDDSIFKDLQEVVMKKIIICLIITMTITSTVNAAEVPRQSTPCNATNEAVVVVESFVGDILTEVQNGLGYSDARAKSNRIFFNALLNGQTNGYSYGELVDIANNAIWQYRDMYLRPDFYANNLEKVRVIIAPVIKDYKTGKITYAEAEFNARNRIYQSVNPDFNPDVEYMKDPLSRDIPSVDNSLFILARKLILGL